MTRAIISKTVYIHSIIKIKLLADLVDVNLATNAQTAPPEMKSNARKKLVSTAQRIDKVHSRPKKYFAE